MLKIFSLRNKTLHQTQRGVDMKSTQEFLKEHRDCERDKDSLLPKIKYTEFPKGLGTCGSCGVKEEVEYDDNW